MSFVGLETATTRYVEERRKRVDAFVARNFSVRASQQRLRETFLRDVGRHLFNFVFAIPALTARKVGTWLEKLGWDSIARRLLDLPLSLKPNAETQIERLITDELLGQSGQQNAYQNAVYLDPELRTLAPLSPTLRRIVSTDHFFERLHRPMKELTGARWTIFQALSSAMLLLGARVLFGEAGFDVYAIGNKVAATAARKEKSSQFFLGQRAGNAFYDIFPPDPTALQVFTAIAVLVVGCAVASALLSVILEPIQLALGVQRRQLHKLLDQLQDELLAGVRKEALTLGMVGLSSAVIPIPEAVTEPTPLLEPNKPTQAHWLSRATEDMTSKMKQLEQRFGWRLIIGTSVFAVCLFGLLAIFISNKLKYDPYREVRSLVAAAAYPTALARLDDLRKIRGYEQHSDYWFWRGRALLGSGAYEAAAEAHKAALKRNSVHRNNDQLIADLVEALAHGSPKARATLLSEIGPAAIEVIAEKTLSKDHVERWMLVDAAEKLGGRTQLDYSEIAERDLNAAQTCPEKKKAVQQIGERKIVSALSLLRAMEGKAELKCLQDVLRSAVASLSK